MKKKDSKKFRRPTVGNALKQFAGAIALALLMGMPVAAQPAATEPADAPVQIDRQERQPTVRTYDKFADPDGDDQGLDVSTYDKMPDPDGDAQSLDYVRYQEENEANDGENPTDLTVIDEGEE